MTPDAQDLDLPARHVNESPDEIICDVRANREAYAARYGYDVRAILQRSRERGTDRQIANQPEPPECSTLETA